MNKISLGMEFEFSNILIPIENVYKPLLERTSFREENIDENNIFSYTYEIFPPEIEIGKYIGNSSFGNKNEDEEEIHSCLKFEIHFTCFDITQLKLEYIKDIANEIKTKGILDDENNEIPVVYVTRQYIQEDSFLDPYLKKKGIYEGKFGKWAYTNKPEKELGVAQYTLGLPFNVLISLFSFVAQKVSSDSDVRLHKIADAYINTKRYVQDLNINDTFLSVLILMFNYSIICMCTKFNVKQVKNRFLLKPRTNIFCIFQSLSNENKDKFLRFLSSKYILKFLFPSYYTNEYQQHFQKMKKLFLFPMKGYVITDSKQDITIQGANKRSIHKSMDSSLSDILKYEKVLFFDMEDTKQSFEDMKTEDEDFTENEIKDYNYGTSIRDADSVYFIASQPTIFEWTYLPFEEKFFIEIRQPSLLLSFFDGITNIKAIMKLTDTIELTERLFSFLKDLSLSPNTNS